jgi:hypothetical protein
MELGWESFHFVHGQNIDDAEILFNFQMEEKLEFVGSFYDG